jgi:hypothetical protein
LMNQILDEHGLLNRIILNTVQWNEILLNKNPVVVNPHFPRNCVPTWPKYSSAPSFPQIPRTYSTKIF